MKCPEMSWYPEPVGLLGRCVRTPEDLDVSPVRCKRCAACIGRHITCNRLCTDLDAVCTACGIYLCDECNANAVALCDAPCEHVCQECFAVPPAAGQAAVARATCTRCAAGAGWLGKLRQGRCGRYCDACLVTCTRATCAARLCPQCATCAMKACAACGARICSGCADERRGCARCGDDAECDTCEELFCAECAKERLTAHKWVQICDDGIGGKFLVALEGALCSECSADLKEDPAVLMQGPKGLTSCHTCHGRLSG